MRLFIAVLLDRNMKKALTGTQTELRRREFRGQYTQSDNLHLTLSFIGEYSDPDDVLCIMEQVKFEPAELSLSGYIGNFGDLLWAGIEQDPELDRYVKQLRHALADAKISFDSKKFYPHITLLRNAQSQYDFKDIAVRKASMTIWKVSLMRSDFVKHGAVYTEIGSVDVSG